MIPAVQILFLTLQHTQRGILQGYKLSWRKSPNLFKQIWKPPYHPVTEVDLLKHHQLTNVVHIWIWPLPSWLAHTSFVTTIEMITIKSLWQNITEYWCINWSLRESVGSGYQMCITTVNIMEHSLIKRGHTLWDLLETNVKTHYFQKICPCHQSIQKENHFIDLILHYWVKWIPLNHTV